MIKNLSYLFGYTIFYHGLYYCPFMEKHFKTFIKMIHFTV